MYYNTSSEECQDLLSCFSSENKNIDILNRFSEKIAIKNRLLKYYKKAIDNDNTLYNIMNCGSFLGINNNNKIVMANFCKNRICPVCNYRKSSIAWGKIYKSVLSHNDNYKYILITLTVRNCSPDTLNSTIDDIMHSFKRITNRKTWKKSILGYVRGLEITFNESENTFHPHVHILCAVNKNYYDRPDLYINAEDLTMWWKQSARLDYRPDTDIRAVNDTKSGVAEVAKYAIKMSDILTGSKINKIRINALKTLYAAVFNRRLSASAGVFKNVNLDDNNLFDELELYKDDFGGDSRDTAKKFIYTSSGYVDVTFKDYNYITKESEKYSSYLKKQYNL